MSDPTIGTPVRDLDAARKRAYALGEKADRLGHPVSLAQTYELLSCAWGFKNWATVKSLLEARPAHGSIAIGTSGVEPGSPEVRLPLADCARHVEIVAPSDTGAGDDFALATASSLVRSGHGTFLLFTGAQLECVAAMRACVVESGRGGSLGILNLNPLHRDRKGWNLDLYSMLDKRALSDLLLDSMMDDFGKGDPLYDRRMKGARYLADVLAALAHLPEGHRYRMSARTLAQFIDLDILCEMARDGALPEETMQRLSIFLRFHDIDFSEKPDYWPDREAINAHRFYLDILLKVADTHASILASSMSSSFDIKDRLREGGTVVAMMQHPQDMCSASAALARAILSLVADAVESRPDGSGPSTAVLSGAEGYLRHGDGGRFLERMRDAGAPTFVVSGRPLPLPGLRGSSAIHVGEGTGRRIECVLVTARDRTDFVFARS